METITAKLESTLESIPGALPSGLAENVEVLFVILAIFLGLRCYVVQPFRIPTGSMQPSLNGIRAVPQEGAPHPDEENRGHDPVRRLLCA